MTTLPQQDTIKQFVGDGTTDDFAIPFYTPVSAITDEPALDVYVTLEGETPIPADDIKVWNVDYTYAPLDVPTTGGTLTFLTGKIPPDGSIVTASRNVPAELSTNFAEAQNFSGANLDNELLQLLMIEQQNKTYAFNRNLSYRVNSYLPDDVIEANTQLPVLEENQIWKGQGDGVIATTLEENPDVSTLRSDLENDSPGTDGALLVGYYNEDFGGAQTVHDALDSAFTEVSTNLAKNTVGEDGALLVGYYDTTHAAGKTVHDMLSQIQTAMLNSYQMQSSLSTDVASATTVATFDTSPPLQSEGHLFYSVSITPKSATSILKITGIVEFACTAAVSVAFWIAQDATEEALGAYIYRNEIHNASVLFTRYITSGTTSATTFKLYGASNGANTINLNALFGAASGSGIIVEEILAYS